MGIELESIGSKDFFPHKLKYLASQPIPTTCQALKESPFFSLVFRLPLLLRKEV